MSPEKNWFHYFYKGYLVIPVLRPQAGFFPEPMGLSLSPSSSLVHLSPIAIPGHNDVTPSMKGEAISLTQPAYFTLNRVDL
jgi:hypothetical protein